MNESLTPPTPREIKHKEEEDGHWFYVFDERGEKAGYLSCYQLCKGEKTARIFALAVWEDKKRKGHGTALVNAFCDWARSQGIEEVIGEFLPTTRGEKAAERFYRQLGFEVDAQQRTISKKLKP